MDTTRQPLRIPAGWTVTYNEFRVPDLSREDGWMDLKGNLLQLRHDRRNRLLDLGWEPEGEPTGRYVMQVYEGDFTGRLLLKREAADLSEIVTLVEQALTDVVRSKL